MNFSQLQERVRLELLRRIERGTLSVSLLARQTGLAQAHVSNFLHGRRQLSLGALDRILAAQRLGVADLLPAPRDGPWGGLLSGQVGETVRVPLVSPAVAMYEPYIRASSVQTMVPFLASDIAELRPRSSASRRPWERFVAVRISAQDVAGMEPVVTAEGLVLLDRHYNSFARYQTDRLNLYAVRHGNRMVVRYADFQAGRVVLQPHSARFAAEAIEPGAGETPNDLLVGRVALVVNRL
jgi:transcriptional regulator with XRE-family HTH domain